MYITYNIFSYFQRFRLSGASRLMRIGKTIGVFLGARVRCDMALWTAATRNVGRSPQGRGEEVKNVFLNCTQHALSTEQVENAGDYGEIRELGKIEPQLFARLSQMSGDEDLHELVQDFLEVLSSLESGELPDGGYEGTGLRKVFVHLPIGSPAFMFLLGQESTKGVTGNITFLFSHSDRTSRISAMVKRRRNSSSRNS